MRQTPLRRAERRLRDRGYTAEVLRRRRGTLCRRHCPFGFLDLPGLAEDKAPNIIAVVLAPDAGEARRLARVLAGVPAARAWVRGGAALEVWCLTRGRAGAGGRQGGTSGEFQTHSPPRATCSG